jgi:hypothetical protein
LREDAPVRSVTVASRLDVPADRAWRHATSFEGINYELMPLMRMTAPREIRSLDESTVKLGERLCRSWVLLAGVIPFEYDDVTIVELEPGRRFLERSPMLTQRVWQHERVVEPLGPEACTLTDRLSFEPKLDALGPVAHGIVRRQFAHRHRRLRARFGGQAVDA